MAAAMLGPWGRELGAGSCSPQALQLGWARSTDNGGPWRPSLFAHAVPFASSATHRLIVIRSQSFIIIPNSRLHHRLPPSHLPNSARDARDW